MLAQFFNVYLIAIRINAFNNDFLSRSHFSSDIFYKLFIGNIGRFIITK